MARKRQLDPEFFTDEEIALLPYEGRLFYAGTWCNCEDTGVFEIRHKTLKAQIFPHDVIDTEPLYKQIRDQNKYIEYGCNGSTYAFIKGFHKRQKIQWPSKSFLPLPPEPYLSMIPADIRKRNKPSMSTHSVLNEPSRRVELSRVEKNRIKTQPYWAAFGDKSVDNLESVFKKGFNIYQFLTRLQKTKKIEIPEEVANKICASYLKNKAGIKATWPWFIVTTQKEWESWNADQRIKEGRAWKEAPIPLTIQAIIAGMKLESKQ